MGDWTRWALGIASALILAAVYAVWKLIAGKANRVDVDNDLAELRAATKTHADEINKKFEALQAEGLRQYRELRTAIEGIQKELNLLDKHSLTSNDLIEMKADINELVKGTAEAVKLIDGMPDRLTSLEATRNKQSEK